MVAGQLSYMCNSHSDSVSQCLKFFAAKRMVRSLSYFNTHGCFCSSKCSVSILGFTRYTIIPSENIDWHDNSLNYVLWTLPPGNFTQSMHNLCYSFYLFENTQPKLSIV